jgi:hypothetical protein
MSTDVKMEWTVEFRIHRRVMGLAIEGKGKGKAIPLQA